MKENFARIKGCFASLVDRVSVKLSAMNINMERFRTFVAILFPPGDFISDTATIIEIFNALTHKQLWDHSSYSAFESIYKEFGEEDAELKIWMNNYKAELAGFKATTKIIDYIKECNTEDEIADSEQSIRQYKGKYDKRYCRRLTMKLKSKITEKSLEYVDEFWRSVADHFFLPSLPIRLDSIHEGCTEISWLISTQSASQIESALHSVAFFRQFQVTKVSLDDITLYEVHIIITAM